MCRYRGPLLYEDCTLKLKSWIEFREASFWVNINACMRGLGAYVSGKLADGATSKVIGIYDNGSIRESKVLDSNCTVDFVGST